LSERAADFAIVGGGAIGCGIAHALALEGARVVVLERSRVAAEASGAAAGILAPRVHATAPGMFELAMASHRLFPELTNALKEETQLDPEYVRSGVLDLAHDEDDERALRAKVADQVRNGHAVQWLDAAEVHAREPALARDTRGAYFDADAYHIHPARFTQALAQAAARRGARVRVGVEAHGIRRTGSRAIAVRTNDGDVAADHVILASGAWMAACGDWIDVHVPVYPARGQILTVCAVPPPIRCVVFGADAYLLPRVDGTVVVGATVERAGFDKSLTAGGLGWLFGVLDKLCPALSAAPFDRAWAGLRPGSPDELPIVGMAPGWDNVTIATGHFRNGIMLTPITARLVARHLLHGVEDPLLAPLSPQRFNPSDPIKR